MEFVPALTADPDERHSRRTALALSRTRILQQLQTACDRRLRAQLEAALADVDEQLRLLN